MSKITEWRMLETVENTSEFQFESGNLIYCDLNSPRGRKLHDTLVDAFKDNDEVGFMAKTQWEQNKANIANALKRAFTDGVEAAGGIVGEVMVTEEFGPEIGRTEFVLEGSVQRPVVVQQPDEVHGNSRIVNTFDLGDIYEFVTSDNTRIIVPKENEALTNALGVYALTKTEIRIVDVIALAKDFESLKELAEKAVQEAFDNGCQEGYEEGYGDATKDGVNEYEAGHADGVNEVIDVQLAIIDAQLENENPKGYVLGYLDDGDLESVRDFVDSFGYLTPTRSSQIDYAPDSLGWLMPNDIYAEMAKFIRDQLSPIIYVDSLGIATQERQTGKPRELAAGFLPGNRHDQGWPY
jgi:hypothetical protein